MLAARVHGHLVRRMLLKYEKNWNLAHRWESTCAPSMLESTQEVQALPATNRPRQVVGGGVGTSTCVIESSDHVLSAPRTDTDSCTKLPQLIHTYIGRFCNRRRL